MQAVFFIMLISLCPLSRPPLLSLLFSILLLPLSIPFSLHPFLFIPFLFHAFPDIFLSRSILFLSFRLTRSDRPGRGL